MCVLFHLIYFEWIISETNNRSLEKHVLIKYVSEVCIYSYSKYFNLIQIWPSEFPVLFDNVDFPPSCHLKDDDDDSEYPIVNTPAER